MSDRPVTACPIVIGNEILSGRTRDANFAYLGAHLNDTGVRLLRACRVILARPFEAGSRTLCLAGICRKAFAHGAEKLVPAKRLRERVTGAQFL
jgi:hypothetical protein